MIYSILGKTGRKVSRIGFGGGDGGPEELHRRV